MLSLSHKSQTNFMKHIFNFSILRKTYKISIMVTVNRRYRIQIKCIHTNYKTTTTNDKQQQKIKTTTTKEKKQQHEKKTKKKTNKQS